MAFCIAWNFSSVPCEYRPITIPPPEPILATPRPRHSSSGDDDTFCSFCKRNRSDPSLYRSHMLRNPRTKRLTCPVLRAYQCKICGATGNLYYSLLHFASLSMHVDRSFFQTMQPTRNPTAQRDKTWVKRLAQLSEFSPPHARRLENFAKFKPRSKSQRKFAKEPK